MKRRVLLISACLITLFSLAGCTNLNLKTLIQKNKGHDFVKVVDLNNHTTRVWDGKGNVKKVLPSFKLKRKAAPTWAKKSFKYVIHYRKHDMTLTVLVYSNYKDATVKGVPVAGNGLAKLSNAQFNRLNDPDELFKK